MSFIGHEELNRFAAGFYGRIPLDAVVFAAGKTGSEYKRVKRGDTVIAKDCEAKPKQD